MTFPRIAAPIYLDHAATTPCDPEVVAAMLPYFTTAFGNPSSFYQLGQEARAAVDGARRTVARILSCAPAEIVFTSGATESNNLALKGVARAVRHAATGEVAPHIIVSAVEHYAVLAAATSLRRDGFTVSEVGCDASGIVDPVAIAAAMRPETCLVSVMYANNEVGAIQPIAEIASVAQARGVPLHTDAVQAAGALPLAVDDLGVDLLSLTGHKFYGPKGIGVLYVRRGTQLRYLQDGGGQEDGRRGGTENVPLIIGFATALDLADRRRDADRAQLAARRDRLAAAIRVAVPDVRINGPAADEQRLPHILNLTIPGVGNDTVLMGLDLHGIAAAAGSACTTGRSEPSHVLRAMGRTEDDCRASLRLSVGRGTSPEDVDRAAAVLAETVNRARALGGAGVSAR